MSLARSWPPRDDATLDRVVIRYASDLDTLDVHLFGSPQPAIWDPLFDGVTWIGLRASGDSEWTSEVFGIMIEHVQSHGVQVHPHWKAVLTTTGAAWCGAVRRLIADVAAMPDAKGTPDE